jgi:UDP-glucuronate 4-epimerase
MSSSSPSSSSLKIIVTGGAGFIGSHTSMALLRRGDDVIVVDELNDYYSVDIKLENLRLLDALASDASASTGNLRVEKFSLCDEKRFLALVEEVQPHIICHLAARAGIRKSIEEPFLYVDSNVRGTASVLEAVRKVESVRSLVFASSSSLYGERLDRQPFEETDDVDHPVSPYAATKRSCEMFCYTYSRMFGFPVDMLRFFTVYGPRGRPDMAPFKFVDRVFRGETIDRYGDGTSRRDYTFVDDIVSGVVGSIDHHRDAAERTPGTARCRAYNLGKGDTISLNDFIALIEELLGKRANINALPEQPGDVPFTQACIDRAKQELHYSPSTTTAQGMKVFIDWFVEYYGW